MALEKPGKLREFFSPTLWLPCKCLLKKIGIKSEKCIYDAILFITFTSAYASGEGIVTLGVCVCVCVCVSACPSAGAATAGAAVHPPSLLARPISLCTEGHALCPVLSRYVFA